MKQGKSLVEMAQELERQAAAKRDFIADTRQLALVTTKATGSSLAIQNMGEAFQVNEVSHGQIADRLQIPKKFYDRLRAEQPDMLDYNVNQFFQRVPEKRMVRTLDGSARAFLSERYRRLDNLDLAMAIIPVIRGEMQEARFASSEITDNRMYWKVTNSAIQAEVKKGDVVQAGFMVTNSEVGLGALKVELFIERLVCLNGMVVPEYSQRKYHVGGRAEEGAEAYEMYSDETLQADDKAFFLKVQDTIRGAATEAKFLAVVKKFREATERYVEKPIDAVQVLAQKLRFNQDEQQGILTHLLTGNDFSAWGLANAVTRTAADVASYDRATELERAGSMVIDLAPSEWKEVSLAGTR